MLLHHCFGKEGWRERKDRSIVNAAGVIAHITPPLTWMILTITVMVLGAKFLERFVFFEDHNKVANGTMILLVTINLPFVVWWIRNRNYIMDIKNNLRIGEKNRILYASISIVFFLMQLAAPVIALWL